MSRLRAVRAEDAARLAAIYRPAVEESTATFEEEAPDPAEMRERIAETTGTYPWLVAERDGAVAGYAYAGSFNYREAYRWSVTTSVYVDSAHRRAGVARRLYAALFDVLREQGFVNAYALITEPNPASAALHESFGFERVGHLDAVGYKHDDWRDVAYWHRRLREPPADPVSPTPFPDVDDERLAALLA